MEKRDWEYVQRKTGEDILGMVMDYTSQRITASKLMDSISKHCIASFNAGVKHKASK